MFFRLNATANPVINNIFEILAPIILPVNISEDDFLTEITPEISSGNDVPMPTMKTPITKVGKLKYVPIFSAEVVKILAEKSSEDNAIIKTM